MVQVIGRTPSSANVALGNFGTGLGSGLHQLAQHKFNELKQRSFATKLKKGLSGLTQEQADLISAFEGQPETQNALIHSFLSEREATQGAYAPQEFSQPNQMEQPQQNEQSQYPFEQQLAGLPALQNLSQNQFLTPAQRQAQGNLEQLISPGAAQQNSQREAYSRQEQAPTTVGNAPANTGSNANAQKTSIADAFLKPQERLAKQKIEAAKTAAEKKEIAAKFKFNQKFNDESQDKANVARERIHDLERLEELEEEGLSGAGYNEFLKGSGLDIPSLMEATDEEFGKITNNFLRGAKDAFGGRVSNYEVEQFLKTIPSLSQSPEGRKRVIANLKRMYRVDRLYNDARRDIIKQHGYVPPYELRDLIEDKIGDKIEANARQFKKELQRKVPKGESKLVTAAGAIGGKALSKIPRGIGGAALGAIAGSALPGLGTVGGGILGGLAGLTGYSPREFIP